MYELNSRCTNKFVLGTNKLNHTSKLGIFHSPLPAEKSDAELGRVMTFFREPRSRTISHANWIDEKSFDNFIGNSSNSAKQKNQFIINIH